MTDSIEIDTGCSLSVTAHVFGGIIVDPLTANSASDEQIASAVRKAAPVAMYLRASHRADPIVACGVRGFSADLCRELIQQIEPHEHSGLPNDALISNALAFLRAQLARKEQQVTINAKRRAIRPQYDKLFVVVGKRDGFKCQHCGSTESLQLDHIIPVSKCGTNDLDNLQLLCQPCNLKKGNKA